MQHIFSKITKNALVALFAVMTLSVSAEIVDNIEVAVGNPDGSSQTLNFSVNTESQTATLIMRHEGMPDYTGHVVVPSQIATDLFPGVMFTVVAVGKTAFGYETGHLSSVTAVTLPPTVNSIDPAAFRYAKHIMSIEIENPALCEAYKSVGGILFSNDETTLIAYPGGRPDTQYTLPEYVTNLDGHAFTDCVNLTSVNLGENITALPDACFARCSNLTEIIAPNLTVLGTNSLKETGLTTFDLSNITSLGQHAFDGSAITSITIPSQITSIPAYCFFDCKNLTDVYVANLTSPALSTSSKYNTFGYREGSIYQTNATLHVPADALSSYTGGSWGIEFKSDKILGDYVLPQSYTLSVHYNDTKIAERSVESGVDLVSILNSYLPANYAEAYLYDEYVKFDYSASSWEKADGSPVFSPVAGPVMPSEDLNVHLRSEVEREYPILFQLNGSTGRYTYETTVKCEESIQSKEPEADNLISETGGHQYQKDACVSLSWLYEGKPATILAKVIEIRGDAEDNKKGRIDALMNRPVVASSMIDAAETDASFVVRYVANYPNAIEVSGENVSSEVVFESDPILRNEPITAGLMSHDNPSAPEGQCWSFGGWNTDRFEEYKNETTGEYLMPCNDIVITGVFEVSAFNLTFLNQDGSVLETVPDKVPFGTALSDLAANVDEPKMNLGYSFAGWNFSGNASMPCNDLSVSPQASQVGTSTISFYIVSLKAGGSVDFANAESFGTSFQITNGATLTAEAVGEFALPESDDCTTFGTTWQTRSMTHGGLEAFREQTVNGNISLYCLKDKPKYLAEFVGIGGVVAVLDENDNKIVINDTCGAAITYPNSSVYLKSKCYTFNEQWEYQRADAGNDEWSSVVPAKMPSYNIKVRPKVNLVDYYIKFELDGLADNNYPDIMVACDGDISSIPNHKDGFSDWKWYNDKSEQIDPQTKMPNYNLKLVSKSLHNLTFSIKVNGLDKTIQVSTDNAVTNVEYGSEIAFPTDDEIASALADVNCYNLSSLSGWKTVADGKTYTTVPNTLGQDISFVRTIDINSYKINIEQTEGLSYSLNPITVVCGAEFELPGISITDNCFENPNGAGAEWSWEYILSNSPAGEALSWDNAQSLGLKWPESVYEDIIARPVAKRRSIELGFQIDGKDYIPQQSVAFNCGEDIDKTLLPDLNRLAECEDCYSEWDGIPAGGKMADNIVLTAKSKHKVSYTLKEKVVYKGSETVNDKGSVELESKLEFGAAIPSKSLDDFDISNANNCYTEGKWLDADGLELTTVPTNYNGTLNKPQDIELTQTITVNAYDVIFKADGNEVGKVGNQNCGTEIVLADYAPAVDRLNNILTDECKTFNDQKWFVNGEELSSVTISNADIEVEISSIVKKGNLIFLVDVDGDGQAETEDTDLNEQIDCGTPIAEYVKQKKTSLEPSDKCYSFNNEWTWGNKESIPETQKMFEEYKVYLYSSLLTSKIIYMAGETEHAVREGNCGDDLPSDVKNPEPPTATQHFVEWVGLDALNGKMPAGEITVSAKFEENTNAEVRYHTIDEAGKDNTVTESYQIGFTFDVKALSTDYSGCTEYKGWKRENNIEADNITEKQLTMVEGGIDLYEFNKAKQFIVHYTGSEGVGVTVRSKSLKCEDLVILADDEYKFSADDCFDKTTLKWEYKQTFSDNTAGEETTEEKWEVFDASTRMSVDLEGIFVRPVVEKTKLNILFVAVNGVELDGETSLKDVVCGETIIKPRVKAEDCFQPADNAKDWEWEYIYATSNDWTAAKPLPETLTSDIRSDIQARPKVADKLFTIKFVNNILNGSAIVSVLDNDDKQYLCDAEIEFPKQFAVIDCYKRLTTWEYRPLGSTDEWQSGLIKMPHFDIEARPMFTTKQRDVEFYIDNVKDGETEHVECNTLLKDVRNPLGAGYTAWLLNGAELTDNDDVNANNVEIAEPIRLDAYSLHKVTFTLNINEIYKGEESLIETVLIAKDNVPFGTKISDLLPTRADFDEKTDIDLKDRCYSALSDFVVSTGNTPQTVGSRDLVLVASTSINAFDVTFYQKKEGIKTNPIIYTAERVSCGTPMSADLFDKGNAVGEPAEYDGEHVDETNPWSFDADMMSDRNINAYPNYISNEEVEITYWIVENGKETQFVPVSNPTKRASGLSVLASELKDKVAEPDRCMNYSAWQILTETGEYAEFESVKVEEGLKFYMLVSAKEPAVVAYIVDGTQKEIQNIACGEKLSDHLKPVSDVGTPQQCMTYTEEWALALDGKSISKDYVVKSGDRITATVSQTQAKYTVSFNVTAVPTVTIPLPTIKPMTIVCEEKISESSLDYVYDHFDNYPQGGQYYIEYLDANGKEFDFSTKITKDMTLEARVHNDWLLTVTATNPETGVTATNEYYIQYNQPFGDKLQGYDVEDYGLSWLYIAENQYGPVTITDFDHMPADNLLAVAVYDKPTLETVIVCESDKDNYPYCWNGLYYDRSGTFPYFDNNNMHLSLLDLKVMLNDTTEISATRCDKMVWDGEELTKSGDYPHIYTSTITGCDSVVILHLTINYTLYGDTSAISCDDKYVWRGRTYYKGEEYDEDDYKITLKSQDGCDSIVTLNLTFSDELPKRDSLITTCTVKGLDEDGNIIQVFNYTRHDGTVELVRRTNLELPFELVYITDIAPAEDGVSCDTVINVTIRLTSDGFVHKAVPNYILPEGEKQMGTLKTWQEPNCGNSNVWIVEAQETNPKYHFTQWDDSTTTNPRVLTVYTDTVIVANFVDAKPVSEHHNITFGTMNNRLGEVEAWIDLTAIPFEDRYVFDYWAQYDLSNGTWYMRNETEDAITIDLNRPEGQRDIRIMAYFKDTYKPYNPGDNSDNPEGRGTDVRPRNPNTDLIVPSGKDRPTLFGTMPEPVVDGLDETPIEESIFVDGNAITVIGHEGSDMQIYSVVGQLLYNGKITSQTTVVSVPAHNVYLVHIGMQVAKVIVK